MLDNANGSETTTKSISRRSIVKGAAWTVPVVAASVAAPASAASQIICPDFGDPEGWVGELVTPDQVAPRPDGGYGWAPSNYGPRSHAWWIDNISTSPTAPEAELTLTKQISVVAGVTYVFHYGIMGTYGTAWEPSRLEASIGDQTITDWSNGIDVPQNPNPFPNYAPRSITYTATTTGTVPFTFTFFAPPRSTAPNANQDIAIQFPTEANTCSI